MAARRLGVRGALVGDELVVGDVAVAADGVVEGVGLSPAGRGGLACAGFVDLQVNGYAGTDCAAASPAAFDDLRVALARDGVTAFAPTLLTGPADATVAALGVIGAGVDSPGRAQVLGAHLEGPWISAARLGTHPARWRRNPTDADVDTLLGAGPVALVTLAPELPGVPDLVLRLVRAGVVVLLGHSEADAGQAHAALDLGASGVTHLFNAMPPLRHRAPGLVGVALSRPGAAATVIADGHHLAAETLALVFAAAAGRVALVTDATAAAGMPEGRYRLGDVDVTLAGGAVRNDRGALAGSAATMAHCVRTTTAAGIDLVTALLAATRVPAGLVARPDLGRLRPGAPADVVVLDDSLAVTGTWTRGSLVT